VARLLKRALTSPAFAGLVGMLVVAALFEVGVATQVLSPLVFARPSQAIASIRSLVADEGLAQGFLITLGETLAATLLALLAGVPGGYLLYRRRVLGEAYEGWLAALFAAPIVLLYPLFLVIFGRGYLSVILMGFIPAALPIAIKTREGLLTIPKTLIDVARSFRVPPRDMFWKVMLPAAVPAVFTGIRLGVMYALVNIVAIEYLVDFGGLGRIVSDMYFRFEVPGTYASILFVVIVSVFFHWGFGWVERRLRPA
jgi:ABC-type nitrate/sulfonate/bicarbonate transport system permease component